MKYARFGLAGIFLLSCAAIAFAQDAGGANSGGMTMPPLVKGVLTGILGGALASGVGWFKNRDTKTGEKESFQFKYAWPTLVVGAIIGAIAHYLKMTPKDLVVALETSPIYGGVVFGAEAFLKGVWRNGAVLIREMLDDVKKGSPPAASTTPPTETPKT